MSSSSSDASATSIEKYAESIWIEPDEIKSAAKNFADENLVTQTPSSTIYKGRLLMQTSGEFVNIVVRTEFVRLNIAVNEITMLKDLKHKNIVPTFKISKRMQGDSGALIIINKHEAKESLDKHLSSSSMLTWMHRLHICVGIARALCYLHYDAEDNHSVIHGNIKCSKILLDREWEPKLHGFGYSVRAKRNQLYLTEYNGSLLYMDPAYETTRGFTNKSDVFSFGIVLFEVMFGKDASVLTPDHKDNWYFARLARVHYEKKTLDDMIDHDLRQQMNLESLKIFSKVAYFCLKEQRSQRPHMKKVLQQLERALELQYKHDQSLALSNYLKVKNLDHLRIQLRDIRRVTDDFSVSCYIGSGGYGTVYKAKLGHFDGISLSTTIKGENKANLPIKCSNVAIKRLSRRIDGQDEQGFLAEIELLRRCKHPNIVNFIGFCNEENEMILIYEYATNGSLEAYLGDSNKIINLTWPQRIKICIDIAYGLEYLHRDTEDKKCIIHRDIKSANILLNDTWEGKIADFGLSKLHPSHNQHSTLISGNIGGTTVYMDPEYLQTGKLRIQSDIYSFGVVLCEIMSGNLAYDKMYNTTSLPSMVRQCISDGTIDKLVDPQLKEVDENIIGLNDGVDHNSLYTFSKVASQCVAEVPDDRPTIEVIIKELQTSLNLQNNRKDKLQISYEAINLGTQNFSNCIGKGRFWRLYEGEVPLANANGHTTPILAKRFDSRSDEGNLQFMRELIVLIQRKHNNIVDLVGYCKEKGEKIIVYEHASNGTLDKNLDNAELTWMKRIQIGLDVAKGLEYLHTGGMTKDTPMIHRDIKSSSILLAGDWRARISNFEEFSSTMEQKKVEHIGDDNATYLDPQYKEREFLLEESDMYSLGVILLEMLLGRSACAEEIEKLNNAGRKFKFKWGFLQYHLRIFEAIKEQFVSRSMIEYFAITYTCLISIPTKMDDRPGVSEVVEKLTLALAYQEDYEIWEPKLPKDYVKLCKRLETKFKFVDDEIYDRVSNEPERIKNFHDLLCEGFLTAKGKAWFSLGHKGKRNVMVSAMLFSYTDRSVRKWKSISESRFRVAAQMLDISNLKIRISIISRIFLAAENYGVYLVFKLFEPRKCLAKHMYVNLKYKWEGNDLHADFATWREDGWMMIKLGQILNYDEDTEFEVFLESFSRGYCGRTVYIEGIEFRTIDNEYQQVGLKDIAECEETHKSENIKKLKEVRQVLRSCSNMDKVQQSPVDSSDILNGPVNVNKGVLLEEVENEKICFMLSEVKADPYNSSSQEFYICRNEIGSISFIIPSAESRFQSEIELLKQQVFGVNGILKSQMLSPNTDYVCYLVFKLSEKCDGLHCPVKVRHGLQWKNNEIGLICFRPSTPRNLLDNNGAPTERDDGCMEVIVWKFNSNSELKNDHIPMNLKFITYEGTMSGLILCGLEIRPM